jgi:cellulose synthase/poly-beta-1,6-N-acetylglucosamine synthase-like glycosyltransferase
MHTFLEISNNTLFFYYLLSNLIYLALLIVAFFTSASHHRRINSVRLERTKLSPLIPPISLIVPAHNEEGTVIDAVESFLSLDYLDLEVIVVNDGSTDETLSKLQDHFQLVAADLVYVKEVPCQTVRGLYVSRVQPKLLIVDKEPGGSKADAVNAGLNAASSPYICVVDADSILDQDALLRIMVPLQNDPRNVVGAGGIVRVLNGSRVSHGRLTDIRLPKRWFEVIQVIEYLRAFLIGREGWASCNLLLIISGGFGVFRRDLVRKVGGYKPDAIGEDMDLVVRLHRYLRENNEEYHIHFVPDPVCWTEVPSDLRSLGRQRARWQKGSLEVLWRNRDMFFRKRYGSVGWLALPYHLVFELLAPLIEIVGYTTILIAALSGLLSREFFLQFLLFGYAFATMISIGAVLQEEVTYRRYNNWRDVSRLVFYCFLEHFPYRQLHMIWRLQGLWQYMRGDVAWRPLKRVGFAQQGSPQ